MRATSMGTINHENNVLVLLLLHRCAVKADRKWRCKQIYSYFEGLYCIFSKKFSGNINFRKDRNKFPEFSGSFLEEISGLTTLAVSSLQLFCFWDSTSSKNRNNHHSSQLSTVGKACIHSQPIHTWTPDMLLSAWIHTDPNESYTLFQPAMFYNSI